MLSLLSVTYLCLPELDMRNIGITLNTGVAMAFNVSCQWGKATVFKPRLFGNYITPQVM